MTSKVFNMSGGGSNIRLASIAVTTPPTKTAYSVGDSFDKTGMVVTATYTNGATKPLASGDFSVNPATLVASDTAVTISYTEGGVTRTTTQTITVAKIAVTVPTQSGTLTYNGSAQTPTFADDPIVATKSADTSATNAGNYTTRFTLADTDTYQWADGSTAAYKDVPWSIGAKALTITAKAQTITYGESIATGTAQVTVSGLAAGDALDSITLTPSRSDAGTGTITPSAASVKRSTTDVTANYTITYATGVLTISKAAASVTAAPTAKSGLTYSGSAQALVNAGTASGGKMQYSLDGTTYSATIPTGTNAGSYTVYYKVVGDANHTDTASQTVNASIAKATLSGITVSIAGFTYAGTKSTPSLSGTVPSDATVTYYGRATASGTATAWNSVTGTTYGAGTRYCYAVLTGMANYEDFTTGNASFTIAKAAASKPTLSKSSITLDSSTTSTTFTVTRDGDGAITATSSDTSVATVSVSGNTVTVSSVNGTTGSATITVKVGEGTNYTAYTGTDATVQVTAQFFVDVGIADLNDTQMNEFAKLISNDSSITNTTSAVTKTLSDGATRVTANIGDTVSITVSSKSYSFRIIGFNHDDLTTATAYGTATATGKAGITFQMVDCLDTTYQMNSSNTNARGWGSCAFRTTLQGTIKNTIAAAWIGIMKKVNKKTSAGDRSSTINTVSDDLFLLSEIEIFGTTTLSFADEGDVYAYWSANNTASARVKKVNGSANYWWERSPRNFNSTGFCCVNSTGDASSYTSSTSYGVAFGFCV